MDDAIARHDIGLDNLALVNLDARSSSIIMLAGDAGLDGGSLHCVHHGAVSHLCNEVHQEFHNDDCESYLVGGDLPGDHVVEEDGLEQLGVGGHGVHEFGGQLGEGGVSRGEDSEGAVT